MDKFSNIWTQSNCLGHVQLMAYIKHTLDQDEVYLVESHLNDCPLCSDALDGLMEEDLELTQTNLKDIKLSIEKRINEESVIAKPSNELSKHKNRFFIFKKSNTESKFRWMAAAGVLILIAFGGYSVYSYIKSHARQLAKQQTTNESKDVKSDKFEEAPSNEISTLNTQRRDTDALTRTEDNMQPTQPSADVKSNKKIIQPESALKKEEPMVESKYKNEDSYAKIPDANKAIPETKASSTDNKNVREDHITQSDGMSNFAENKKIAEPAQSALSKKKSSEVGMSKSKNNMSPPGTNQLSYPQYNNTNLSNQSIAKDEKIAVETIASSAKESENAFTDYDKAMQYYNAGDYKRSIHFFERALNKAEGTQQEDIRFQLAQAYLKTGKIAKAEKQFEILSLGTKYKNESDEALKRARK
jgi:tetratricopeptide (TPR) repeat protein